MKTTINAADTVDILVEQFFDIERMYREVPRGSYIGKNSPYKDTYEAYHRAEQIINAISYVLGTSFTTLYATARAARKWHKKTNWEKYLPQDVADHLLSTMINQYRD